MTTTDLNNKFRAVFLVTLMVFSVFAGSVSFAGAATGTTSNSIEVDTNASDVTPGSVSSNTTEEFGVFVSIKNTSLSNDSGEVDVFFEGFDLNVSSDTDDGDADDLTIKYTEADITNGTLNVSANVSATAPPEGGVYNVWVTDLRRDNGTGEEYLIKDENITFDDIEVGNTQNIIVSGSIKQSDSTPAKNDTLKFVSPEGYDYSTSTNESGGFNVSIDPNVEYRIEYWQGEENGPAPTDNVPDYYPLGEQIFETDSSITETLPSAYNLTVNISAENGADISDALTHFNLEANGNRIHDDEGVLAGDDGKATRELAGTVDVYISAPQDTDLVDAFERVSLSEEITVQKTLREGVISQGQVQDANQNPISNASIRYDPYEDQLLHIYTETNDTGQFSERITQGVDYGVGFIQDQGDGTLPKDGIPDIYAMSVVNGSAPDIGTVDLPNPYNLTINVTDENGNPISDSSVYISHDPDDDRLDVGERLFTGENGLASVEVKGNIDIHVSPPDGSLYEDNFTEITVENDSSIRVILNDVTKLNGTVKTATGDPASPVHVFVDNYEINSNDDNITSGSGAYDLEVASNNTYEIDFTQEYLEGESFPNDGIPGLYQGGTVYVGDQNITKNHRLPKGHDLNISVVNDSGVEVPNAEVHLSHSNGTRSAHISGTTDSNGMFIPEDATGPGIEVNGTVRMSVENTDTYLGTRKEIDVNTSKTVTLTVTSSIGSSGRIIEPDGTGATEDRIQYESLDGQENYPTTWTDAGGNFTGQIGPRGEYGVGFIQTASQDDWEGSFPQDGVPDVHAIDIVDSSAPNIGDYKLPTPYNLTINVTDQDGNPIPNSRVNVQDNFHDEFRVSEDTTVGDNGKVTVEVEGEIGLYVSPPEGSGYVSHYSEVFVGSDEQVNITLPEAKSVTGTIEYADGSHPTGYPTWLMGEYGESDTINESGAFEMLGAQNSKYTWTFDQRPFNDNPGFPNDGNPDIHVFDKIAINTTDKDLGANTLPQANFLQVQVVNESNDPITNVDARIGFGPEDIRRYHPASTNDSGYIQLSGAEQPGIEANGSVEVQIHPSDSGHPYTSNQTTITLDENVSKTIVLKRGTKVEGRVNYSDETYATEQKIRLRTDTNIRETWTNGSGYFSDHVKSDGTVDVGFYQVSDSGAYEPSLPRDGVPDIYAFDQYNATQDVNLQTETLPNAHVLNVTVVDETGNPVSEADININHWNGEGRMHMGMTTNSQGQMTRGGQIGVEVIGTVDIGVTPMPDRKLGGNSTRVTIESDEDITLTLPKSARVNGTIEHADGTVPEFGAGLFQSDPFEMHLFDTDESGAFETYAPINETFEVDFSQRDGDLESGVDFPRDGKADFHKFGMLTINSTTQDMGKLVIPEGHLLHVKVENESGAPLTDVPVQVNPPNSRFDNRALTNESGFAKLIGADQAGMEVNGTFEVNVTPWKADLPYLSNSTTVTVEENRTITLQLEETPSITGKIRVANGSTAKDDLVWAFSRDSDHGVNEITNETGHYQLDTLRSGETYNLGYYQGYHEDDVGEYGEFTSEDFPKDGSPDMYALESLSVGENDTSKDPIDLPNASRVNITVVNESNDPVEWAEVSIYQYKSDHGDRENAYVGWVEQTRSDGKIYPNSETTGMELRGNVTIQVSPPENSSYLVDDKITKTISVGENDPRDITVQLNESVRVNGSIEHADGDIPEYGVDLFEPDAFDFNLIGVDDSGSFTTFVPPNDTYELYHSQRDADLESGVDFPRDGKVDFHTFEKVSVNSSPVDLGHRVIPEANLLHVKIVNELNDPVQNVPVSIRAGDTLGELYNEGSSNESGFVRLDGADQAGVEVNGTVEINARPNDAGLSYLGNTTTTTVNENDTIVVQLQESPSVSGQIDLANGSAASNNVVWAYSLDSDHNVTVFTNESGFYNIEPLRRGETYSLMYSQEFAPDDVGDYWQFTSEDFPVDGSPDMYALGSVEVGQEDISRDPIQLPNASRVNITVVNESNQPVEWAKVEIFQYKSDHGDGENGTAGWVELTREDGKIYPNNVSTGRELRGNVTIRASPSEKVSGYVDNTNITKITVGENDPRDITLALEEGVQVNGSIEHTDGSLPEYQTILYEPDSERILLSELGDAGSYEAFVPPEDTYDFYFSQRDGDLESGVDYPRDGKVDIYNFESVYVGSTQEELGTNVVPEANLLHVQLIDENNDPISDVPIEITAGNVTSELTQSAWTNDSGYLRLEGANQAGIEANGTVEIQAKPLENGINYDLNTTRLDVSENRTVTIQLDPKDSIHVPEDYDSIQEAVDKGEPGIPIVVSNETFNESIQIDREVTLLSETIWNATAATQVGAPTERPVLDGGDEQYAAFDIQENVSDVRISGFEIRNYNQSILAWNQGTNNVAITDNTILNSRGNGILVGPDEEAVDSGTGNHVNWTIASNEITDSAAGGIESYNLIDSKIKSNKIIRGSDVSGPDYAYGIGTFGWNGTVENVTFEKNTVLGEYNRSGIDVQAGTFGSEGTVQNVHIVNNYVSGDLPGDGISLSANGTGHLTNVLVENNTVHNATTDWPGVGVFTLDGGTVSTITIRDNELTQNLHGFGIAGMNASVYDAITVRNNTISNNSEHGVIVAWDASAENLLVQENILEDNGESGVTNNGSESLNATDNWWGAEDGPSGDYTGSGDPVFGDVTVEPYKMTFDFAVELQQESQVLRGDEVNISTWVSNNADKQISNTSVALFVDKNSNDVFEDEELVASQIATFSAGEDQRTINLTYENVTLEPGTYEYQTKIRKKWESTSSFTNGTLTVEEPLANISYSELDVPSNVTWNIPVNVTANVTNTGDQAGTFNTTVLINGSQVKSPKNGTLSAGETKTVEFEAVFDTIGARTVSIDDLGVAGTQLGPEPVEVVEQEYNLALEANETEPLNGTRVQFTVTEPDSGEPINNSFVTVGESSGTTDHQGEVVLPVYGDGQISATANKSERGIIYHEATLDLDVREESDIVYSNLSVDPSYPVVDETVTINATVTNQATVEQTYNATVTIDGEPVDVGVIGSEQAGTIGAGVTKDLQFTTSFDTAGQREVRITDSELSGALPTDISYIAVERIEQQLNLTANRSEITKGETIQFTVRSETGDPVENATVELGNQLNETAADGTVAFSVAAGGDYTATATKRQTNRITYLEDSVDVRVNEPGDIQVTDVTPLRTQLYKNETLTVEVTAENPGDLDATENVTFNFLNTTSTKEIPLGGGNSTTLAFEAQATEVGETAVTVNSDTYQTITVDPALSTTGFSAPSSVTIGDELVVSATVRNYGSTSRTKTVTLFVGNESVSSTVPVAPESTNSTQLTWDTSDESAGDITLSVDDQVSQSVTLTRRSVDLQINSNVTDTTTVNQTISFNVTREGSTPVNASVRVAGQQLQTGDNGMATTVIEEPGSYIARAAKEDSPTETFSRDSIGIALSEPANITVTDVFLPSEEAYVGDSVEVLAVIENEGGVEGEIELVLTNSTDHTLTTRNVTLGAGSSETVSVPTQFDAPVEGEQLTVQNVPAGNITVKPQSVIAETSLNATAITSGDSVRVTATVHNRGGTEDSAGFPVNFTAGEMTKSNTTEAIGAGNSTSVSKTFTFSEDGTHNVTANGELVDSVTVAPDVVNLDLTVEESTVTAGTPLNFTVTRADNGEAVTASLHLAGQTYDVTEGDLSIAHDTGGTYEAVVSKEENAQGTTFNSDSVEVEIQDLADIKVTNAYRLDTQAYTGDNATIEVRVTNDGDLKGSKTISLTAGDTILDNETVEVSPQSQKTITLNASFETAGIRTLYAGGIEAGDVEIDPQTVVTGFTVDPSSVTVGNDVTVNATVHNRGATGEDDFAVNMSLAGDEVANKTVNLTSTSESFVEFTQTLSSVGTTEITVNERSPKSVLVNEEIVDLSLEVTPESPTTDDKVEFKVTNSNGEAVEDATIVAAGQVLSTNSTGQASATFASGTVTATVTKDEQDTTYNPASAEFTVNRPAEVYVIGSEITTDGPVYAGTTAEVDVTLLNVGGVAGEQDITLQVDGETANSTTKTVSAGSMVVETLTANLTETGLRSLTVAESGDMLGNTISVQPASTVANYTVNRTALTSGESFLVQANVVNRGGITDTVTVSLKGDAENEKRTIDLAAGETTTVNFTRSFESDGTVQINSLEPTEISVAPAQVSLSLSAEPTQLSAGETIEFTVTDEGGNPVPNTTVNLGNQRISTDQVGTVQTNVRVAGNYTATATKSGTETVAYEKDTTEISVTDPLDLADSINFGAAQAAPDGGQVQTETLEIRNDGGRTVLLGSGEIRGDDANQFDITSIPSSLAPGDTGSVTVEYTPRTRGDVSAELRFRSDTPEQPVRTVSLSGTGEAPGISVNESTLSFGEVTVGDSTTKAVEISNPGDRTVRITTESLGDGFSRLTTDGISIGPDESKTFRVRFEPSEASGYGSRLRFASTDPFNGTVTVRASGTGLGGELETSPTPDSSGTTDLSFGSITQGSTASESILLENTGTDELSVTPIKRNDETGDVAVTVGGENYNDTELVLDEGESRFITVSVTPTTAISPTANITLVTNSTQDDPRFDVAATTLTPSIEVGDNPADPEINFGDVAVGGSTTDTLVIRNTGDTDLEVDTSEAIPSDAPFSAFQDEVSLQLSETSVTVQPGEVREFPVTLAPTSPGSKESNLTLHTNDPNNETITVRLQGEAIETDLTGSPNSIDFGTNGEGDTVNKTVTITNDGNEELTQLRVSKTGSDASQHQVGTVPSSLPVDESTTIPVTYSPTAAGSHSATVTFEAMGDLAGSSTFTVSLSGEATPPSVTLTTDTLQFGYVNSVDDETENATVQILNDGRPGTNLTVESVTIEDDATGAYDLTNAPEQGTEISASTFRDIDVEFDPSTAGEQTATLVIETDDPDQDTSEVSLSGVGAEPNASVDRNSIQFGQVQTGEMSEVELIEITNNGGANLNISDIRVTGESKTQFNITDEPGSAILAPGASETVAVVAEPGETGVQNATLSVSWNSSNSETNVPLSAEGIAPELSVTSDLNGTFGDGRIGSSTRHSLTISNDGNATLKLDDPSIIGTDSFSIVTGDSSINLAPDESVTYAIAFSPEAKGPHNGTVELTSTDHGLTRDLNGTGVESNATLSEPSHNFGNVPVDTSADVELELVNDGAASLRITSVALTGENAAAFSVSGLSTGTIETSDNFTVKTTPTVTGSASAQLEIETESGSTITASLGTTGVEQDIEIDTQQIEFEPTRLGSTTTNTVAITNEGNIPLNVSDLYLTGADADQFDVSTSTVTVQPGSTEVVEVAFTPSTDEVQAAKNETAQTAELIIQSNDPDEGSKTVPLEGTGTTPDLRVTDRVQFGSTAIGDTSTRQVTIENDVSATASVELRSITVSGGVEDEFAVSEPSQRVLEPGESTTVTVSLTPQVAGDKYGSLNIITNDPREPGKSVFLSNTETIVTVEYGSAIVTYENVEPGLQPEREFHPYPDADAELTGTQPFTQTSDDFQFEFDGQAEPFGAAVSDDYGAIRYISATKTNITANELTNNTFTFRVSKAALGTQTDLSDIKLVAYDGTSYEPVPGGTTKIREEQTDYIFEATVDHLSQFAIVVEQPQPEFNMKSDASLSTSEIERGESVSVSRTLTNDGYAKGTQTVNLTVDDTIEQTKSVTLEGQSETVVEFTYTPADAGDYTIEIEDQLAGTLSVTEKSTEEETDESTDSTGDTSGGGGGGGAGESSINPATASRQLDEGVAQAELSGGTPVTQSKVILEGDATGIVEFEELLGIPSTSAPEVDKEFVGGVRTQIQGNEQGRIQIGIQRSHIEELGVAVNSIQIYRYHFTDVEWEPLETEVVRETDTEVVVEAETGFTDFVVFGESATESTDTTTTEPKTTTPIDTTTDTPTSTDSQTVSETTTTKTTVTKTTETSTPGFGFLIVLASLLVAVVLRLRRIN